MSFIDSMPIGISGSFFGIPTRGDLENCRKEGFDCIEVCVLDRWMTQPVAGLVREWKTLAADAEAIGLIIWSVHLPYAVPYDISRNEPGMAEKAVTLHSALIEAAGQTLRPRKCIIHASHEPIENALREARFHQAVESLTLLTDKAAEQGGQLAVECLPRTCIGNDSGEIERLIRNNPKIGICCDTNHLLTERAEDFIRRFNSRIVTLHVSDYDGIDERHWLPGRGCNHWNAIMDALREAAYTGPLMLEVRGPAAGTPLTLGEIMEAAHGLKTASREGTE